MQNRKTNYRALVISGVVIFFVIPLLLTAGSMLNAYRWKLSQPQMTSVPNLTGLDLKTAEIKARDAQLQTQVLHNSWDTDTAPGLIVLQSPQPGDAVEPGTVVGLEVAIEDPDKQFWEEKGKRANAYGAGP